MSLRYYANAQPTTLSASCTSSATTLQVTSTSGLPISYPFILILDRGTASEEVVLCTNGSGTSLTVTRGYDSSPSFAHSNGAEVAHGIAAIDAREANTHVNATSGVHGVTGALMGTTDTQTVTNKTLGTTNIINGFTASRFIEADGSGKLVSGTKAIPTGVVVGTSDAQTLTNKTLTSPTINTPTITGASSSGGTYTTATIPDPTLTFSGLNVATAWDAYTPTLGNWVVGNGTVVGAYKQIGKTVHFRAQVVAGTTTTYGSPTISLPVAANATRAFVFGALCYDSSAGAYYPVSAIAVGANALFRLGGGNNANLNATTPFAWAASDELTISGTYEAA